MKVEKKHGPAKTKKIFERCLEVLKTAAQIEKQQARLQKNKQE